MKDSQRCNTKFGNGSRCKRKRYKNYTMCYHHWKSYVIRNVNYFVKELIKLKEKRR